MSSPNACLCPHLLYPEHHPGLFTAWILPGWHTSLTAFLTSDTRLIYYEQDTSSLTLLDRFPPWVLLFLKA